LLPIAIGAAIPDDASTKDLDRMQGEWQLVSMVRNGQEQPKSELAKMTRTVAKNELTIIVEGAEGVATLKSTIVIDATKNPKTIDVTRTNGPTKGQTALGIYEFDGDNMKTCVAPPGKDRPTEFDSRPGSEHAFTVWKPSKAPGNATDSKLDPKATGLIKQVGKLIQNAKSIRTQGSITLLGEARKVAYATEWPNRLRLRARPADNDKAGIDIVCDGRSLFVHRIDRNEYTETTAPLRLADFGDRLMSVGVANAGILFRNLLTDDPAETLMLGVNAAVYAGIERIDDRPAHYLKFTQDDFDWELWVAAEGNPLVLKMRSKFTGGNMVEVVETYTNWQIDASAPEGTFTFKPPEGAKKVERLSAN
jgi:uncharacterized protein (TIGR03067 family)